MTTTQALVGKNNPILQHDLGRLTRDYSPHTLKNYRRRAAVIVTIIVALSLSNWFLSALFLFLGIIVGLISDFQYVMLPIANLQREIAMGHWDMVRITTLDPKAIIAAKHESARLQATRRVTQEIALRVMGAVPLCFLASTTIFATSSPSYMTVYNWTTFLIIVAITVPYVLEPRWRSQTLIWYGIIIGIRVRETTQGSLTAFGLAVGLRMLQLGIIVLTALGLVFFGGQDYGFGGLFVVVLGACADYLLYHFTGIFAMNRAYHLAYSSE